jgi:hypothetical protein
MENLINNNLQSQILRTIVWFDLFSQPLTAWEIYKYLNYPTSYNNVISALETLSDKIGFKDGFFFLIGRENIITERFRKYNYFKRKIKKARIFTKLISLWPSILGVAVSNIIGDHNLKDSGDIDLLIITKAKRIWSGRFICTLIAKVLGLRPNIKTKRDKICLSFYISSDNLNLEKYLYNEQDFYFVYCLADLTIVYNYNNIWSKFYKENIFLKKYLPNNPEPIFNKEDIADNFKLGLIGSGLEKVLKKFQLNIMPQNLKNQVGQSSGVMLDDNIIKLFLIDKRPEFINLFNNRIK